MSEEQEEPTTWPPEVLAASAELDSILDEAARESPELLEKVADVAHRAFDEGQATTGPVEAFSRYEDEMRAGLLTEELAGPDLQAIADGAGVEPETLTIHMGSRPVRVAEPLTPGWQMIQDIADGVDVDGEDG